MIVREDGPGDIFAKLRRLSGTKFDYDSNEFGDTNLSRGILCLWCVSFWVAIPCAAAWEISQDNPNFFAYLVAIFGLSASAILVDIIIARIKK